jgi:prepilin-type N-terminal cleavage/methylation domain-containing protein
VTFLQFRKDFSGHVRFDLTLTPASIRYPPLKNSLIFFQIGPRTGGFRDGFDRDRAFACPLRLLPLGACGNRGFTLVELLVVTAIVATLIMLVAPAFTAIKSGGDVTAAAYTIKDTLEQARNYAMANNTYVWVGFYEEDGSVPSATPTAIPGTGRVVLSVVASTDGTNVYGSNTGTIDPTRLVQVGKLIKINNVHLPLFAVGNGKGDTFDTRPTLEDDPTAHFNYSRFGELNAPIPNTAPYTTPYNFQYPVGNPTPPAQYPFTKLLQFNPRGESRVNGNTYKMRQVVEIGLEPAHGNVADSSARNVVAIQFSGFGGNFKIYRP